MRIRLRGVNRITKRLADGTLRTYWYAWKGGPPLRGEPGTPEFVVSYNEAMARKVTPPRGTLLSVLQGYQASEDFLGLAPRSRSDYISKIKLIEKAFGDFPLSALTDVRTRGIFKAWRERLAVSSRRQADYAWVVLARVLSVVGRGPWTRSREPVRSWRPALSREPRRENLDTGRRGRLPRAGAGSPAFTIAARALDRTAAGRSASASLVGL
jgi:hypothetical protein